MIDNQNKIQEKKVQFENELFFQYLEFFSTFKIEYTDNLEKDFFDEENEILKIPRNPTFKQTKKIIIFLNNLIKYKYGTTAKKRLTNEETKYNIEGIKKDNFENSLLRESLYEQGKKYILDNMKAPNSNKLLKDVLKLDELSERFKNLSLKNKKREIDKILWILSDYEDANPNSNNGGLPIKFIENKKLYCVGYSYLADIIFEKLDIKHYVATGLRIKRDKRNPHSVSVLIIDNKEYIFDPTALLTGILFLKKIKIKNKTFVFKDYKFTIGNSETEVLAQNMWNLSQEKTLFSEKIKLLEYALKLSPNNILIKTDLNKLRNKIKLKN